MAESKPVTVAGGTHPSFAEAERKYGIRKGVAEQRYRVYGWTLEEASELVPRQRPVTKPQAVVVRGVRYQTLKAAARAHGVEFSTFKKRLRKGLSPEAALALPESGYTPPTKALVVGGTAYDSIAGACRAHGVWDAVFRNRVNNLGWSVEQALELAPPPNGTKKCLGRIYKVTHNASGKSYIGLTLSGLDKRWLEHLDRAFSDKELHPESLQVAIRSFGAEAFTVEEVTLGHTLGELAALERRYIREFKTRAPAGFNLADGGAGLYAKGKKIEVFGTTYDSIALACRELGVPLYAVHGRLSNGLSPNEAFSYPYSPKAKAVVFKGVRYRSHSELARAYGVEPSNFQARIQRGESFDAALNVEERVPYTQVIVRGQAFASLRDAAVFHKVSYNTVQGRRSAGASVEDAVLAPVRNTTGNPIEFNGQRYSSVRALSRATGVSEHALGRRLAKGWSTEDAVCKPLRDYGRAGRGALSQCSQPSA